MAHRNEAEKLWRRLRRQGFTVERTNGDHIKITRPGMIAVFAPSTPSDHHSLLNVKAKLKRATKRMTLTWV